jgi:hypothetical protein
MDLIREAQGLSSRRRGAPVSYTAERVIEEAPAPPKRAKAASSSKGRAAAPSRSSGAPSRSSGARKRHSNWSDDDDDDDDDQSESDDWGGTARHAKKGKKSQHVARRSERDGAGGKSMYREDSDDDGGFTESDSDEGGGSRKRRGGAARAAPAAWSAAPSVYEKLLSQRPAGEQGELEYLARPRGKSYTHCVWVSEATVLAEPQGLARLKRWQKAWAAMQAEFEMDPTKEGEWEPYPEVTLNLNPNPNEWEPCPEMPRRQHLVSTSSPLRHHSVTTPPRHRLPMAGVDPGGARGGESRLLIRRRLGCRVPRQVEVDALRRGLMGGGGRRE